MEKFLPKLPSEKAVNEEMDIKFEFAKHEMHI